MSFPPLWNKLPNVLAYEIMDLTAQPHHLINLEWNKLEEGSIFRINQNLLSVPVILTMAGIKFVSPILIKPTVLVPSQDEKFQFKV